MNVVGNITQILEQNEHLLLYYISTNIFCKIYIFYKNMLIATSTKAIKRERGERGGDNTEAGEEVVEEGREVEAEVVGLFVVVEADLDVNMVAWAW